MGDARTARKKSFLSPPLQRGWGLQGEHPIMAQQMNRPLRWTRAAQQTSRGLVQLQPPSIRMGTLRERPVALGEACYGGLRAAPLHCRVLAELQAGESACKSCGTAQAVEELIGATAAGDSACIAGVEDHLHEVLRLGVAPEDVRRAVAAPLAAAGSASQPGPALREAGG